MTARLVAAWRRLTATSLACLVGAHEFCTERMHRAPLSRDPYCACPRCPRHPHLLHAAKEAAR